MDLRQLEIFSKVVELRSFSRAAAATYLTQPTVSEHIKALEDSLGLKLLDRLASGTLATVAVEGLQLSREFFVVTHRARTLSPICQVFLSFLLAEPASLG